MKIMMANGTEFLIDEQDHAFVRQHKWHLSHGYAKTSPSRKITGSKSNICWYLHRVLLNPEKHLEVDHINGDRLDNRRSNLRIVTKKQNRTSRHVTRSNTGFKGVKIHKNCKIKKYAARITKDGKEISLGYFRDPREAAAAYNIAATELFGEYAVLNKI